MKPPKFKRNLNELRVTRKTNVKAIHGDGHGWAVSYADLLMVLLSFFILYFNFSDASGPEGAEAELAKIAISMSKKLQDNGTGVHGDRSPNNVAGAIVDELKMNGVRITDLKDHIVIDLQNSAFASGDYKINSELKQQIDEVIGKLIPHADKITLTVIGHADRTKLRPRNDLLRDNFDLSSIRALNALKYTIHKGFPEHKISSRAASSYDRDARSISFEVRLANTNAPRGGS